MGGRLSRFGGPGIPWRFARRGQTDPAYPSWKNLLLGAAAELELQCRPNEAAVVRGLVMVTPPGVRQAAQRAHDGLQGHGWAKVLRQNFDLDYETIEPT